MTEWHIDDQIECLAESIIFFSPADEEALKDIQQQFMAIETWARQTGTVEIERIAQKARGLLDNMVHGSDQESSTILQRVSEAVSQLQTIISLETSQREPPRLPRVQETDGDGEGHADAPAELKNDSSLLELFIAESREHLENAEESLLILEREPHNCDGIDSLFRALHTIKGTASLEPALSQMQGLTHEVETFLVHVRDDACALTSESINLLFEVLDALKRMVDAFERSVHEQCPLEPETCVPSLLIHLRNLPVGRLDSGTVNDNEQLARADRTEDPESTVTMHHMKDRLSKESGGKSVIKVDSNRLDSLIDAVGELVIVQAMVSQSIQREGIISQSLHKQIRQLDKITRELQQIATSIRMVSLQIPFRKTARMARDLAHQCGKRIEFCMSGETTEIDKAMVDALGDPLMHLVRNAIDHGIEESPDIRTKLGKQEVARVELRAFYREGNVHIEVEDDGRGLDLAMIRNRAQRMNKLDTQKELSHREAINLIFHPGFSTVEEVTDISGRGVGLDVVKKQIERLRGSVEVISEPNKGCIFKLVLPLTLAIIDGMVLRVGAEHYIIPMLSILRSIKPQPSSITRVLQRGEMIKVGESLVPILWLSHLFNVENAVEDLSQGLVMIVENEGKHLGLVADELIGKQQCVIKSLGQAFQGLSCFVGGAIMPDGEVGLILDVGGLITYAYEQS